MRSRFARNKRRKIGSWPQDVGTPADVAARAVYLGSAEHKDHPSHVGPAALRSDATVCDPRLTKDVAANTAALRRGIERGCVSSVFEGGFPKYVWTWIGGDLFEARHINGPQGTYKGYKLEVEEYPEDAASALEWADDEARR